MNRTRKCHRSVEERREVSAVLNAQCERATARLHLLTQANTAERIEEAGTGDTASAVENALLRVPFAPPSPPVLFYFASRLHVTQCPKTADKLNVCECVVTVVCQCAWGRDLQVGESS